LKKRQTPSPSNSDHKKQIISLKRVDTAPR